MSFNLTLNWSRIVPVALLTCLVGCVSTGAGQPKFREVGVRPDTQKQAEAYAHYLSAVLLERKGDRERAIAKLEQVPLLDPEAVTPTIQLIQHHYRAKEFNKALGLAERAVERTPDKPSLYLILGKIYNELDDFDKAMSAFEKAIELNPDNIVGYGALVELQESTNDLVAALDVYDRLLELSPDSAVLYFQRGLNLVRMDDPDLARASFEKALALNPKLTRARFYLGLLQLEQDNNAAAVEQFTLYLLNRPKNLQATVYLIGALARLERFDAANREMAKVLEHPDADTQHALQAMYLAILSDDPAQAADRTPGSGAPLFSALLNAMAREDRGLSYDTLLKAMDEEASDIHAECGAYLNDLLYLFGEDATAATLIEHIDRYLASGIDSQTLRIIKARTLMSTERYAEAVEAFEDIVYTYGATTDLHYYLAVAYEELDNFRKTEEHLKAYLRDKPDDADVLNFLGYLYAERGVKLDEALELLEKALALDPRNPYYLDSLGWIYYQLGDADKAIDLIQQAIYGMDSDDAILRDHLGDAYLMKGEVQNAVAEWERAHRLDDELEGVKDKLERYRDRDRQT